MIHKIQYIKYRLKKFFKNPREVFFFFLPIVVFLISMIPVPYYITIGGGAIKIDKKIEITNEYQHDGSLNAAYVKETRGTLVTYLLSYVIPSYERQKIEDITLKDEEIEEYRFREKLEFTSSLENAKRVVFTKLKLPIEVEKSNLLVLYVDKDAITDLKVKDQILKVDGVKVSNIRQVKEILGKKAVGDMVDVIVLRNKKEVLAKTKVISYENEKKMGIYLATENQYKTSPTVDFHFSNKEAGPSGGLMVSLSLYNKLTKEDITGGKKIVGTGTIDEEGNVGEIGGIKYKLKGAVSEHADIFLVPDANYKEAMNEKIKNDYAIDIIRVSSFDEAIEALECYQFD